MWRFYTFLFLQVISIADTFGGQFQLSESALSRLTGHPTVNQIHRDRFGILWIATQDGLLSYDGSKVDRYDSHQEPSHWLPNSNVTQLSEDSHGRLYILTFSGGIFAQSEPGGEFLPLPLPKTVQESELLVIELTMKNELMIGHKKGLLSYDPKFGEFSAILQRSDVLELSVGAITQLHDNDGTIALCTNSGLMLLSIGEYSVDQKLLLKDACSSITEDSKNTIYIATHSGEIVSVNTDGTILGSLKLNNEGNSLYISDMEITGEGLLIATDSGLFSSDINLTSFENISREGNGLSSLLVQDIYFDKGHYWIATLGGLDILSLPQFEVSILADRISSDITTFSEDENHIVWVGSYSGLWSFDSRSRRLTEFKNDHEGIKLIEKRITALSYFSGKLWIGFANGGVQTLDIGQRILTNIRHSRGKEDAVTDFEIEPGDSSAWVSTSNSGLLRIRNGTIVDYRKSGIFSPPTISNLVRTTDGKLLVLAESQLYQYMGDIDSFQLLDTEFGQTPSTPILYSFAESSDGTWWLGTKDYGLFRSTSRQPSSRRLNLEPAGHKHDHFKGSIYCIEIDELENVWAATNNGLIKMSRQGELLAKYSEGDGLQGDQFNLGASISTSNGQIIMGGLRGFNNFKPLEIDESRPVYSVKITHLVSASGEHVSLMRKTSPVVLPANHKQLRLDFTTLDFRAPTKNQYRYKLKNFDKDWIDSGARNFATYTNLPPGDYTFEVQAANSSGIWSPEGASLDLKVLPPPWLTWWAYCLYTIAAGFFLWGLHRIYYSFVIDRKAAELAFEMHLAEERADDDMQGQIELQQDLVQSAYEHNKTTLALIADFLEKRGRGAAALTGDGAASKLSHQARLATLSNLEECLYFQAGGSVVDMYKLTEAIFEEVLPQALVEPSTIITINEVTKQLVPASIASPVSIMICELVENALLHAFSPQSPANYVHVTFVRSPQGDADGDFWLLEVSDNGVGMEATKKPGAEETGFGMQIVHQLADQLNAKVSLKRREGTLVSIQIPAQIAP